MAAILTEAHEYICNGEVDDVHVGDALHLLVGQHRHQHQQVPAHPHLVMLSIARTKCDSCCYDYQELCSCYNHYHCCNHDYRADQENCEVGHAERKLNNRLKDQNLLRLTRPVIILVMVIIFVSVVIITQPVIILVIVIISVIFNVIITRPVAQLL